ncbi:MAG: hypothetical protein HOO67_01540 [Candidatus Peribacteraceae bacterium]|nr:hypothetical protein [Candidatus Peribacteraceae bacterium]
MTPISVDFETFYDTKQKYGIKDQGTWRYLHDDRFDPYLIAVCDGSEAWAGHPRDFNWSALDGRDLLSHNRYFDNAVQTAGEDKGLFPKIRPSSWHCTANLSSYLCNRRALADAVSFLLGRSVSKDVRDRANGKTAADMKAEGWWDEMLQYGREDGVNCHELWTKHAHKWPEHERRLSNLTIDQGTRGMQIDVMKLKEYIVVATNALRVAEEQLPWVKEGRPPTSPKAIAELCNKHGIPAPPVKSKMGEEAFIAWETAYCKKYPWIEHVANWRSINKFLDSLNTICERLQPDGVLGFSLKYFGAHTGRWSGDAGINMQNLRKEPLFLDDKLWLISDLTRLKEIANSPEKPAYISHILDIRSLFIARPGKKLIISDLSQIEPRVLAWIVQDKAMLDLMAQGQSPYEAHARATMGFAGGNMKKEDKEGYALAKARVLGLGFGCGWEKFIVVAQAMAGLDITKDDPEWVQAVNAEGEPCFRTKVTQTAEGTTSEQEPIMVPGYGYTARKIVNDYREGNPKVVALWKRLDTAFKDSVGGDFEMELPSGRSMTYREVRKETRMERQKDGTFKRKSVFTALIGDRRFPIYGGLLTENLVQATARDVFAGHVLDLQDHAGLDVLFTAHDEAINEAELHITVKEVEGIMSRAPEWMPGLPVAAEGCESNHYKK